MTSKQRQVFEELKTSHQDASYWYGPGESSHVVFLYVTCSMGVAAIGEDGEVRWQR